MLNGLDSIGLTLQKIDQIETLITTETAAVFIEPVMGEKGYVPCSTDYLYALRNAAMKQELY